MGLYRVQGLGRRIRFRVEGFRVKDLGFRV